MKKKVLLFLGLLLFCTNYLTAGGEAETGRDMAAEEVGEGQLLPVGAVDPANYLQDFSFEKKNNTSSPLKFEADMLKTSVWEKGEANCIRISLISNKEAFFKDVGGEFIIYFQNPELLNDSDIKDYLRTDLLENKHLNFFFFEPQNGRLLPVKSRIDVEAGMEQLSEQRKQYMNNVQLQKLLSITDEKFTGGRVHILWITDENIVEKQSDANFFNFSMDVLSSGNTTFSYLGYGEIPNWTTLNTGLMKHNGNSYYSDSSEEICEKISRDIGFFSKPAIEKVSIDIVWSQYTYELSNLYSREYYPEIKDFYPAVNNNRPRTHHSIGGLNYDEKKRLLHYVQIPAMQSLIDGSWERHPGEDRSYKIGTVYVKYYIPMYEKEFFLQQDLEIKYTDAEHLDGMQNDYVFADMIIQNTPLILQEVSTLVNKNRNYLAAIQLINAQRNLLRMVHGVREDAAVLEDIGLLDKYYELLFKQAKTMNLL